MNLKFNLLGLVFIAILLATNLKAQDNNVGISEDSKYIPDKCAILDISSQTKGILIPRIDTLQVNAYMSSKNIQKKAGLLVYQKKDSNFYYFNGIKWKKIGSGSISGGGGCLTLNDAYNCKNPGEGRQILANNGMVLIAADNTSQNNPKVVLGVSNQMNGTLSDVAYSLSSEYTGAGVGVAVSAINSADGVSLLASNTSTGANLSTIESHTASTMATTEKRLSAVAGITTGSACGVVGEVESGGTADAGVWGNNMSNGQTSGVEGLGYVGVYGGSYDQTNNLALYAYGNSYAEGSIYGNADLAVNGNKQFKIDHPIDPENKFLAHNCLESPEVLNVYRGNAVLDSKGEAEVKLPDYFSAININYSYNLTPVGASAPGLFVKNEVSGNTFSIGGGKPGMKVSWTLYAERNDKYMQNHPQSKQVEIEKTDKQKGKYLHPEFYGKPSSYGINYLKLNDKLDECQKNNTKMSLKQLGDSKTTSIQLKNK